MRRTSGVARYVSTSPVKGPVAEVSPSPQNQESGESRRNGNTGFVLGKMILKTRSFFN